jgi:hypothetical protein
MPRSEVRQGRARLIRCLIRRYHPDLPRLVQGARDHVDEKERNAHSFG